MLTTDPLYFRPLLPVITIKNTANNTTLYTYNSFTDSGTTDKVLYCSVNLSQNTFGEFTIQFEDQNKSLESTVTVGSRVQIDCGKQSSSLTRLISGLVRKKGYNRGANNKVLYTISGSSTGIRLNELLRYVVSEAKKTADGITPDKTDVSRKADTLLAANLGQLTTDGILSISNLAANSDVETFIASLSIEYGQLQDIVSYIEQQSGGQVVVDQNDLVNFRYEIKNNLTGRGFTIKNNNDNKGNDDADDTMYLVNKNWSYEDDFYTSSNYANKVTAIMRADPRPSSPLDLGFIENTAITVSATQEFAVKFRPTHTRITPGDIYVAGMQWDNSGSTTSVPEGLTLLLCNDSGGVPQNSGGIAGAYVYFRTNFEAPLPTAFDATRIELMNDGYCYNSSSGAVGDFSVDTTKDYWLIFKRLSGGRLFYVGRNMYATLTPNVLIHTTNYADLINGGSSWTTPGFTFYLPCFAIDRYRSSPFTMWDPKAMSNIQSGLSGGQAVESIITETAIQITTRDSMMRHLAGQLYTRSRPRASYSFPSVLAPNVPPFPGDPIIINDSVLGLSTSGNQIALTTCGDMTYQWGDTGSGSYEAPTNLSIQAIATPPRYR